MTGRSSPKRFAVDAALGRLARHLRLMGFDASYQSGDDTGLFFQRAAPDRIALTRVRHLRGRLPQQRWLFVRSDNPDEQVVAVLGAFSVSREELRLFSRCARCNRPVTALTRSAVRGRVPDYVWQTCAHFSLCEGCGQMFWRGGHAHRYAHKVNQWFKRSSIKYYDE